MRLAVLDLGLGAFHVDLFEIGARGARTPLLRRWSRSERVRLGPLLPAQRLGGAAVARGLAAAERLCGALRAFDARCPLVGIASSALRAAEDGALLCEEIRRRHGAPIELLSGEGEARLSYLGAALHTGAAERLAVIDLGSWSLELATGTGGECDLVHSTPLGVARLRDVHLAPERALDRGVRERLAATVRFAAAEPARAIWDRRPDRFVVTGGAAGALASLADELGLRRSGADPIGVEALSRLADVLAQFRPIELPALGAEEARSDAIAVGAVVLHTIMELLGATSAAISPCGRREGVAVRHLGRPRPAPAGGRVHTAVT